jgi:hypothetical protein
LWVVLMPHQGEVGIIILCPGLAGRHIDRLRS